MSKTLTFSSRRVNGAQKPPIHGYKTQLPSQKIIRILKKGLTPLFSSITFSCKAFGFFELVRRLHEQGVDENQLHNLGFSDDTLENFHKILNRITLNLTHEHIRIRFRYSREKTHFKLLDFKDFNPLASPNSADGTVFFC